jgi:hypothetical protein
VVQRKPAPAKKPKLGKTAPFHGWPPNPGSLSLLAPDLPGWRTVSDDEIYAPLKEAEAREQQELEAEKIQKLDALRIKMKGWSPEDQEFALELLARVFRHSTNIDPRGVSDANRQPILSRYEQWLRAVDEQRLKECADNPPGVAARSRAAFRGDKPCVSWFSNEWSLGRSYASSEIEDMDRQLRINRGALSDAVDQVYLDVFLYRKETDPKMLQMQADAAGMVDALGGLAHSPTGPLKPGTLGKGKVAPKRNKYPGFEPVPPALASTVKAQVDQLSSHVGEPIPANRALIAPWIGRGPSATSEGWLRSSGRFWSEFKKQFSSDYDLLGPGHSVTPALAARWGWHERTIGQKLEHHHVKNGEVVVAIPAGLHPKSQDARIHAKVKIEGTP